ncbi:NADH:ubiquinone oxidoreductase subunit NDUFA12 [Sphingosinicella sp. LY1275]|uniref:NADH:ubiquinone oxidoreductase subunit NDUFA12 n=1 Tax=Sphingosinicella sp. LY1275 TaxID=3095379 RepID=UPI002ADEE392|nr:NADH:ubiquinone oxidoreductase subunit NDUFA12 [Sphingosinicella sp. LY1275]MEA1014703.1 NADH:ubiquinone oxidoreductase subunit NDUFA12 [Sphingosinicella sp. LY1275]
MGLMKKIFTWWDGATIGTSLWSWRNGERVGTDSLGNVYFRSKKGDRRWVIYNGPNDSSRIPPEWFSWMHRQIDGLPDEALPPIPKFAKPATGNLTGTPQAYRPSGALERGGQRQAASGDYQAWTPE